MGLAIYIFCSSGAAPLLWARHLMVVITCIQYIRKCLLSRKLMRFDNFAWGTGLGLESLVNWTVI